MGDSTRYRKLAGGMQIEARRGIRVAGSGSLGCIAETLDTGQKVLLSNAHVIGDFALGSEITVGQPTMSSCCDTFSYPVGKVLRTTDPKADFDCDAAIAVIEGIEAVPQVLEIGAVMGCREIDKSQASQQIPVQMRGAATGQVTKGRIYAWITEPRRMDYPSKGGHFFYRDGTNQFEIFGDEGSRPFAQGGDSGSVILDMDRKVVGLLHGVIGDRAYAAPISYVLKRMNIRILSGAGEVPIEPASTLALTLAADARTARLFDSSAGRAAVAVFEKHFDEVRSLVRENLRVAAVWRRNGGPEMVQALVDSATDLGRTLPAEVGGKPFGDTVRAVLRILEEHGSSTLRADIGKYGEFLAASGGHTLAHLLRRFAGES